MSRCESRTGTGHRCGLEQFHEGNHRCPLVKCEGAEWPNVPTIESAARKALAVLRKDSTSYAWCVHCKRRQGFHAPKCALAEAIESLEGVL